MSMSQLAGGVSIFPGILGNLAFSSACVPAGAALLTAAAGRGVAGVSRITLCCSTYHSLTILIQAREQYHSRSGSHAHITSVSPAAETTTAAACGVNHATADSTAVQHCSTAALPAATTQTPATTGNGLRVLHCAAPNWLNPASTQSNSRSSWIPQQHMQFATRSSIASAIAATAEAAHPTVVAAVGVAGREVSSHSWSQGQLLNALRQIGLEQPAAMAVQQAWQSGLQHHVPAYKQARLRPLSYNSQQSPLRVLARVRRLLSLHQKASAAIAVAPHGPVPRAVVTAAVPAPSETADHAALHQQANDNSKQQQQESSESAAAGAVAPSWGQLDLQVVLHRHPGLLLVPPIELAASLDGILQGVSRSLAPRAALQFVENSNDLTDRIITPTASGDRLAGLHQAYVQILGVAPKPRVLENASSSYQRYTVAALEARLKALCSRFGPSVTHSLVSLQPHLLSSSVDSLLSNANVLQNMLGLTEPELQKFLMKAPRLLNTRPDRLRSNLGLLYQQLISIGLTAKQTSALLLRYPALLSLSSVTTNAKIQGLKELLGPFDRRLAFVIRSQPSILCNTTHALSEKMDAIQKLLGTDRDFVCSLVARSPAVLTLTTNLWESRLQAHCKVLGVTSSQLLRMIKADTQLLGLQPENLQRKLDHMCQVMGWKLPELQQSIACNSRVLLYEPRLVTDYMQFTTKLVSTSALWLYGNPQRGFFRGTEKSLDNTETASTHTPHDRHIIDANPDKLPSNPLPEGTSSSHASSYRRRDFYSKRSGRRPPCWQVYYARNVSARLPLRLEYLISVGLQEQVALINVLRQSAAEWDKYFPDFANWSQLRLQSLRADPSDWPQSLVQKATAASKAIAGAVCEETPSSAPGHSQQQAAPWSWSKSVAAAEAVPSSTDLSNRMRRCRSDTAAAVIAEEEALASDCVEVSSGGTDRRRRRIDAWYGQSLSAAATAGAAQACPAAAGNPNPQNLKSFGGADRGAGSVSLLQQQQQVEQQQAEQQHVQQLQSLQQQVLQNAYMGGLVKPSGGRYSFQKAATGRAWLSASVQPEQQLHQQQDSVAAAINNAGTQQHAWQWQQQQLGASDLTIGGSSNSSSPFVQGLVQTLVALQETGLWAAYRFSHSSSSREDHILSLSELLRRRSQQLAFDRVGWQAVATCG